MNYPDEIRQSSYPLDCTLEELQEVIYSAFKDLDKLDQEDYPILFTEVMNVISFERDIVYTPSRVLKPIHRENDYENRTLRSLKNRANSLRKQITPALKQRIDIGRALKKGSQFKGVDSLISQLQEFETVIESLDTRKLNSGKKYAKEKLVFYCARLFKKYSSYKISKDGRFLNFTEALSILIFEENDYKMLHTIRKYLQDFTDKNNRTKKSKK